VRITGGISKAVKAFGICIATHQFGMRDKLLLPLPPLSERRCCGAWRHAVTLCVCPLSCLCHVSTARPLFSSAELFGDGLSHGCVSWSQHHLCNDSVLVLGVTVLLYLGLDNFEHPAFSQSSKKLHLTKPFVIPVSYHE